jgi:hypothetical protein
MMNQEGDIMIVELSKNDSYLRELGSEYSSSHYYGVSVCRESGF